MKRDFRARPLLRFAAACFACCALPLAAQAAKPLPSFKVDNDVTARVERADSAHFTVRFLPGGKTQTLDVGTADEEGHYGFEPADYNFDGHQDLALAATLGQVNRNYAIYLYDTARQRFAPLRMPANDAPHCNCDGLINVAVKPKERMLYSSCRGGPIWYTDAYRYDGSGRLYLHQSTEAIPDDVSMLLDGAPGDGPPTMLLTYDAHGRRIARRPEAYGGGKLTLKVQVARLPLHDAMTDAPTKRYVVAGDTLELLDASPDFRWLKVLYRNPRVGAVSGWVSVEEATKG
ncbi:XAC2610-related protein [Burkholderia stagnalis]|uniref:XAC2610-related protein n=1 Tax=Burkholderia stagnalis TaxID=1503054 RepID=UPI000F585FC7|nr:hypothetical protein [Burkholderia stagnalis]RQQ30142.1 hypothetical protein DF163_14870 [Burkholderia stagnalis]RQQ35138.1 hypothetical protein DF149_10320 [Burkholderia stagnalis]RQQ51371.1 hypothetical protein DF162_10590 [Burkholderia stagnalis]RQX98897.1 hypothetical protein DF119_14975 [Burkholderia stagnalis]RQY12837.1 hypothetical protein DF118_13930 [Burkholderia stagnalis]